MAEPGEMRRGASMAFIGCYALGAGAGILSAMLARRTFLKGPKRPMALELPTYKTPSLMSAAVGTVERGRIFLRKAGTNILAICIILWWLGAFPRVAEPHEAAALRSQAALSSNLEEIQRLNAQADHLTATNAKAKSFIGVIGRAAQPAFAPLGFDWKITVGVMTSFAAREVFVSTMSVMVTGDEHADEKGMLDQIARARRDDGTPLFSRATAWSTLVFFVLAMQCLPTLAVTARETGHVKWALLQFAWMSGLAYAAAAIVHALLS